MSPKRHLPLGLGARVFMVRTAFRWQSLACSERTVPACRQALPGRTAVSPCGTVGYNTQTAWRCQPSGRSFKKISLTVNICLDVSRSGSAWERPEKMGLFTKKSQYGHGASMSAIELLDQYTQDPVHKPDSSRLTCIEHTSIGLWETVAGMARATALGFR